MRIRPLLHASVLLGLSSALAFGQEPAPSANPAGAAGPVILTPPPAKTPRINGPKVFGVTTNAPILYTVPATGDRPMEFSAEGLPLGLKLDAATGQITGALKQNGEYAVRLKAKNALGQAERTLRIRVGDNIALTPPMGWNSWNCWGASVSQEKVLSSAKALVEKGLRDHGWSYINIDDTWQGVRGGEFNAIQPNSKFPDIKGLGQQIHAMGLRFGIYSTPWRGTYEGHIGSTCDSPAGTYDWIKDGKHNQFFRIGSDDKQWKALQKTNWKLGAISFAEQDAKQWAQWEVDYLKYDWFPNDVPHTEAMSKALRRQRRDIVFSLSNTAPYDSAPDFVRLANAWRTTGDIRDTWQSVSHIGFSQDRWAGYAGPGHWNDPDMLVVGKVGWGPKLHPTSLTPDEQYTHISLWCLLSAPLLIGCDIAQIDDFTLGLLSNDEVIEIDQDPLGKQATQALNEGDKVVYSKTLEDGSTAVGLFNRGSAETTVTAKWGPWGDLSQLSGKYQVRDLWRQKDLGVFDGKFEAKVAPHGVVLVRLIPAK